jgi:uncharacterized protein DUF5916
MMRRLRPSLWAVCLALQPLATGPAGAQDSTSAGGADGERPTLRAGSLTSSLILDGRLGDAAWAAAPDSIANLTMVEPREGGTPVARTMVKVLAGPDELVIGIRCDDPDPSKIAAPSKGRDAFLGENIDEDHVLLVFDTFQDGRSGYVFACNASGARFDGLVIAQGEETNGAWDAIWEAKTTRDAGGWSAEFRIPAKSLGFKKGLATWGFNVQRRVPRLQETSRWASPSRDYEVYQTSRGGLLSGLPTFDQGAGLSIRPALVGRATKPGKGLETEYDAEPSLDVTKTLGSNLLSSLTINTDFAETEVDARQINVSRFPVFFPEKRSFFLAGADIFEFGVGLDEETLLPFFTRRIGLFGLSEDEQAGVPIDLGAKVTGRVGDFGLGGLVVGTRRVDGLFLPDEDLTLDIPRSTMGAVRVTRNIFEESSLGMLATFGDQSGRDRSWSGGLDFTYRTSSFREDQNFGVGVWGLMNDREDLFGEKSAYGVRMDYPNDPVDIALTSIRIGDGFNPSMGFVPRTGVHIWDLSTTILPRPWWPGVREVTQELNFTFYNRLDNSTWSSYGISARPFDILFHSGDRIEFEIKPEGDRVPPDTAYSIADGVDLPTGSYEWTRFVVGARSAEKRRVRGYALWESGDYYNGDLSTIEAGLAVRPFDFLTVELTGERSTGTVSGLVEVAPDVDALARARIEEELVGVRMEINLSPDFQISSFTQYDTQSREFGSNNRLRWTFRPQGDLFVVYNHTMERDLNDRWRFVSNQIPLKIQYTWRF